MNYIKETNKPEIVLFENTYFKIKQISLLVKSIRPPRSDSILNLKKMNKYTLRAHIVIENNIPN